jgi:mono/diheme cytochrome c family protein
MKLIPFCLFAIVTLLTFSCQSKKDKGGDEVVTEIEKDTSKKGNVMYIELTDPLDEAMIAEGKNIFEQKCDNCHRLDSVKLVGPGWVGITNRRSPEWIMNMIINVGIMVDQDSAAHQLRSEHDLTMPEQNLAVDKARAVLEFLRNNDLEKTGTKDLGDKKGE